jgi:gluconokinase
MGDVRQRHDDAAPGLHAGIDIGTTAVKALSCHPDGTTCHVSDTEYPLHSLHPDHAEQDPDVVLDAVAGALRGLSDDARSRGMRVAVVTFSAAMHSLMALDGEGDPLTWALTFADNRARDQADRINAELGGLDIYRRTGTPIHPMSPLTKLLWFREEDPERFAAAVRWMSLKEYVLLRLFGERVVDLSIASATGLLNLERRDWDDEVLAMLGVAREALSPVVPTTHRLSPDVSALEALGLDATTTVVVGANDGVLANLGAGAITQGVAACSIGTSAAVRVTTSSPSVDPRGRLFCYALTDDHWVVGGAINNGGILLRWVRDELFPDVAEAARARQVDPYEALIDLADGVGPGAGGLVLLPYLLGERAPHWSGLPRGVLFGLRREHRRGHIVRAVLEGVVFQLYSVARLLADAGIEVDEYRVSGGAVASSLWRQILADVFDTAVTTPVRAQGSAFGAVLLGMHAVGELPDLADAAGHVELAERHEPDPANTRLYHELHGLFERLYDRVEPEFKGLAALQTRLLLADRSIETGSNPDDQDEDPSGRR